MRWFLERISSRQLPIYFGIDDRQDHPGDFKKFLEKGILKRSGNLDEMPCKLCEEETHSCQIRNDGKELFCVCENGNGTFPSSDEELSIFEYDHAAFLRLMAKELGIATNRSSFKEHSRYSPNSLFYIGDYKKKLSDVLYLRTADDFEIPLSVQHSKNKRRIILFNTQRPDVDESENILYCSLENLLAPTKSKLLFDPRKLSSVFDVVRRVSFDEQGCLRVDSRLVYTAEIGSAEYYFLLFLFEKWEIPQTHHAIRDFIKEKRGKDVADTPQNFCSKLKSRIKKKYAIIDTIITKPKRGYYAMSDKKLEEI